MEKRRTESRVEGFTLIELLIVITIIGILAAIVIPTYEGSVRKANEGAAVATLNTIDPEQPQGVTATGRNFYYTDPENGICFSRVGPAGPNDETL